MAGRLTRLTPPGAWRAAVPLTIALSLSGCMTVDVLGQTPASPAASPVPSTDSPPSADALPPRIVEQTVAAEKPNKPTVDQPAGAGTSADVSSAATQSPLRSVPESPAPETGPLADFGARATEIALGMLGRPYRLGGITPEGFDCSGLLYYSFGQLGVSVPRDTQSLRDITNAIPDRLRRIGDLVFFHIRGRQFSHVGLYVGEGRFLHAPASGGEVRIEKLSVGYWVKRYAGTRRLSFAAANAQPR